jgi:hypothetical protein
MESNKIALITGGGKYSSHIHHGIHRSWKCAMPLLQLRISYTNLANLAILAMFPHTRPSQFAFSFPSSSFPMSKARRTPQASTSERTVYICPYRTP